MSGRSYADFQRNGHVLKEEEPTHKLFSSDFKVVLFSYVNVNDAQCIFVYCSRCSLVGFGRTRVKLIKVHCHCRFKTEGFTVGLSLIATCHEKKLLG